MRKSFSLVRAFSCTAAIVQGATPSARERLAGFYNGTLLPNDKGRLEVYLFESLPAPAPCTAARTE